MGVEYQAVLLPYLPVKGPHTSLVCSLITNKLRTDSLTITKRSNKNMNVRVALIKVDDGRYYWALPVSLQKPDRVLKIFLDWDKASGHRNYRFNNIHPILSILDPLL